MEERADVSFHADNGIHFARLLDGAVKVTRQSPVVDDHELVLGQSVESLCTLSAESWASVVAAVCKRGETSSTWTVALDSHNRSC